MSLLGYILRSAGGVCTRGINEDFGSFPLPLELAPVEADDEVTVAPLLTPKADVDEDPD